MVILKRLKNFFLVFLAFLIVLGTVLFIKPVNATPFCNPDACKAADAKEAEAREKATEATKAADSLESVITGLESEIAAIEAKIAQSEREIADLELKIQLTEEKLTAQRTALANLLVDMHFDSTPDAILILAGSNSISELAEKESREETVKTQVTQSAKEIKKLKTELEDSRAEIKRILVDQENQRAVISEKRNEQTALLARYRDNAENYSAEAETARIAKEQAIAEEIARLNSSGVAGFGVNTYIYQEDCPHKNLAYGTQWGYVCQCTSYAGYKAYEHWGVYIAYWGNAYSWDESAAARGYRVDTTPAAYTVAVSNSGEWGHVMWVESVNSDGTINLSEYNNSYSAASHLPGDYGYRSGVSPAGLYFIHFDSKTAD